MTINQAKTIYCIGIGGIGVSALARLFVAMGKEVSGSDLKQSEITDELVKLGVKVQIGSNKVEGKPDLVVYTSALPKEELDEISGAKLSQAEAVGQLMLDKIGIAVTGTNGKSTTTALLGLILEKANLDPIVLIGSLLSPKNESEKFKANARFGKSAFFVAESDEYARKMLENQPKIIIVTNIALDHLDYYKDLDDIKSAFTEYTQALPEDGILIYNADDHNTVDVCKLAKCHKFTFGIHHYADLQAININNQTFDLHYNDEMIGKIKLQVPGIFNVSNALGAILAAIKLGITFGVIKPAVEEFAGLWRRFEKVGEIDGKVIISDYAHHPDGLNATIQAAKEFFPGKKILYVFQPHQRNRTEKLLSEFIDALLAVDDVIVPEIFDVAGREHGENISSARIVEELQKQKVRAFFAKDLEEAEMLVREKFKNFDVILIMGAGDIDLLARRMLK